MITKGRVGQGFESRPVYDVNVGMCGGESSLSGKLQGRSKVAGRAYSHNIMTVSSAYCQAAVAEGAARLEAARSALQTEQQEVDAGAEALAEATERAQVLPHPRTAEEHGLGSLQFGSCIRRDEQTVAHLLAFYCVVLSLSTTHFYGFITGGVGAAAAGAGGVAEGHNRPLRRRGRRCSRCRARGGPAARHGAPGAYVVTTFRALPADEMNTFTTTKRRERLRTKTWCSHRRTQPSACEGLLIKSHVIAFESRVAHPPGVAASARVIQLAVLFEASVCAQDARAAAVAGQAAELEAAELNAARAEGSRPCAVCDATQCSR